MNNKRGVEVRETHAQVTGDRWNGYARTKKNEREASLGKRSRREEENKIKQTLLISHFCLLLYFL